MSFKTENGGGGRHSNRSLGYNEYVDSDSKVFDIDLDKIKTNEDKRTIIFSFTC